MAQCLNCHEHQAEYDAGRCDDCHVDLQEYGLRPITDFSHRGDFVKEHKPEVGGYFTVAGDGSCGFMSAAAFQRTYTSSRESSW